MKNEVKKVKELLTDLGSLKSAKSIADKLRRLGIKGSPDMEKYHPVAIYAEIKLKADISVCGNRAYMRYRNKNCTIKLSPVLTEFVDKFNDEKYKSMVSYYFYHD